MEKKPGFSLTQSRCALRRLASHLRLARAPSSCFTAAVALPYKISTLLYCFNKRDEVLLLERRKADGANFLDGNPKELLPGLRYLGDAGESALYGLATPTALFLIDAPALPSADSLAARFTAYRNSIFFLTAFRRRSR